MAIPILPQGHEADMAHPAWPSFTRRIRNEEYGPAMLLATWGWWKAGWACGSAYQAGLNETEGFGW